MVVEVETKVAKARRTYPRRKGKYQKFEREIYRIEREAEGEGKERRWSFELGHLSDVDQRHPEKEEEEDEVEEEEKYEGKTISKHILKREKKEKGDGEREEEEEGRRILELGVEGRGRRRRRRRKRGGGNLP